VLNTHKTLNKVSQKGGWLGLVHVMLCDVMWWWMQMNEWFYFVHKRQQTNITLHYAIFFFFITQHDFAHVGKMIFNFWVWNLNKRQRWKTCTRHELSSKEKKELNLTLTWVQFTSSSVQQTIKIYETRDNIRKGWISKEVWKADWKSFQLLVITITFLCSFYDSMV